MKPDLIEKSSIKVDHREKRSGIPWLLNRHDVNIEFIHLKTGDYIINDSLIVERKSAGDFIQSIISNRLFNQCSRLHRSWCQPLLLIEGDVYSTNHNIDHNSIRGALLSIAASWQIPVIYSSDCKESVQLLIMLMNQSAKQKKMVRHSGYKPKRLINRRLHFLQGLSQTGPVRANRLYQQFHSLKDLMNAGLQDLENIEGIGKKQALRIHNFLTQEY